ncbi:MAG: CDP-glucose 4,6-dehydratase [Ferruginibacter sp.]
MAKWTGKMEKMVNLHQLSAYYKGKKVFVTGHTGFKGAWLIAWLHQLGANVKGYALAPEQELCMYNLMQPLNMAESVIADIRNKEKLLNEIVSFEPDYIFHLAAQPLVRRSYIIPVETFEINVIGTANLLEAVNKLKGKCTVVIITTDKVYENKEQDILYNEADVLGGYDPYSASKACTEIVVSSFRNSFFSLSEINQHQKGIATARAGNVIGGGDFSDNRIIPDIIRALQINQVIEVRNPYAVRPWQHVLEPLAGYLILGTQLSDHPEMYGQAYNFGPKPLDHLSVKELVTFAINAWGSGEWKNCNSSDLPHEAGLLKLDISKAAEQLKWTPKLSAAQAIEWTINWYKKDYNNALAFSFEQIENYMKL